MGKLPASLRWLTALAAALGGGFRIAPLFDQGGRLLQQWPTEDGYMLLTVSRNIALGLGMSTSAGTLPTNGVQPFATLTWALSYMLAGGDKRAGVLISLLMQTAIAAVAAVCIYQLGRRVLASHPRREAIALVAAGGWFASSNCVPHTMNCLESGWYALAVTLVALFFAETDRRELSGRQQLAGGALLGWAFWVRNDAVFLILAVCLAHVIGGFLRGGLSAARQRFVTALGFGATSVVVAAPWMISNYQRFGHIMPISGQSESAEAVLGGNLHSIPPVMLENLTLLLPIPNALQDTMPFVALGVAGCLAGGVILHRMWRSGGHAVRVLMVLVLIYFVCLVTYYGVFFGANHFIARYFFPTTPFTALFFGVVSVHAFTWLAGKQRALAFALPIAAVALVVGTQLRLYRKGSQHEHVQVIAWVLKHVPDKTWIGAPQTGTLGYFHDYTHNLDGKVNAEALRAREEDTLARYILDKDIQYICDWASVSDWMEKMPPEFVREFDLLVHDPEQNLAVIARHGAPRLQPPRQLSRPAMH